MPLAISEQDAGLVASSPMLPAPVPLAALPDGRFVLRPASAIMTVVRTEAGEVVGLEVAHGAGVEVFERTGPAPGG